MTRETGVAEYIAVRVHFSGSRPSDVTVLCAKSDGEVFVSASDEQVLCASLDGEQTVFSQGSVYLPVSWFMREYPQHYEGWARLVQGVRKAARKEWAQA